LTSPLTDEQVDFVNSLWSAKVPAADIARVIERMKEGNDPSGQPEESEGVEKIDDVKPAQSPTTVPQTTEIFSTPTATPDISSLRNSQPTPIELPAASGNDSSASNPSPVLNKPAMEKQPPIVLAPPPASPSSQPSLEPVHWASTDVQDDEVNAELTDEQIDFVTGLSVANIPSTEVARVMQRMRSARATSVRGVGNRGVNQVTAASPPSYKAIY